jgi:transposase
MDKKQRRKFSAKEKVSILKQYLVEKKPVSDLCDKEGIHPTIFYRWQKKLFEDAALVFENKNEKVHLEMEKKVRELEDKLIRKNEILSELMEEYIALKKSLGES